MSAASSHLLLRHFLAFVVLYSLYLQLSGAMSAQDGSHWGRWLVEGAIVVLPATLASYGLIRSRNEFIGQSMVCVALGGVVGFGCLWIYKTLGM